MLAFPGMLVGAASEAGMPIPENVDDYDKTKYPHFFVFAAMQLGTRMPYPSVHYDNAKVIAVLTEEEVMKATADELIAKGFK